MTITKSELRTLRETCEAIEKAVESGEQSYMDDDVIPLTHDLCDQTETIRRLISAYETQAEKGLNRPWLVGRGYRNLNTEYDTDHEGNERQTPPGSPWRVAQHNHDDHWDLVCDATGAWICATAQELREQFTPC